MSTIDRDRMVRVSSVRADVAILIVLAVWSMRFTLSSRFSWYRFLHPSGFRVDPSDPSLYAVDMARANVRRISLFSGNARKRVR
jgi:hypothetical protein